MKNLARAFVLFTFTLMALACHAGTFTAFGPQNCVRGHGRPVKVETTLRKFFRDFGIVKVRMMFEKLKSAGGFLMAVVDCK